jgi:hypothetical protein
MSLILLPLRNAALHRCVLSQEIPGDFSDDVEVFSGVTGASAADVLFEGDAKAPMQFVLVLMNKLSGIDLHSNSSVAVISDEADRDPGEAGGAPTDARLRHRQFFSQ